MTAAICPSKYASTSSAVFGLGAPEGLADGAASGEIGFELGNYEHKQANIDANLAVSDSLAARVTALFRDKGTQVTDVNSDRLYVAPALTWRPSDATDVTLTYDWAGTPQAFRDQIGGMPPFPIGFIEESLAALDRAVTS